MGIYVDLIKKVHPDHNPNFPNGHYITCEINAHKNDECKLTELGIKYGLIPKPHGYVNPEHKPETVFVVENGVVVRVYHKFRNKFHTIFGVVVNVHEIKRGKFVGGKEVTIVTRSCKVMKFKSFECRIDPVRKANIEELIMANSIATKEMAIPIKPTVNDFNNVGLNTNTNYNGYDIGVRYKGNTYAVEKTTKTYVYLKSIFGGKTIKVYPQSLDCKVFSL